MENVKEPFTFEGMTVPQEVSFIPLSLIKLSRDNPGRKDLKRINKLLSELERDPDRDLYPVTLSRHPDGTYQIVGNGRHRVLAYREADYGIVPAIIINIGPATPLDLELLEMEFDRPLTQQ